MENEGKDEPLEIQKRLTEKKRWIPDMGRAETMTVASYSPSHSRAEEAERIHMTRCRFCGRPLKSRKAKILGAGAVCLKKFRGFTASRKIKSAGQLSLFLRPPWSYRKATRRDVDSDS